MTLQLSDDAWVQIGLHLKPRHLSKLMRTCKRINRLVDNEDYWTRVAAHLVWRDHHLVEQDMPYQDEGASCRLYLTPPDPALYHMMGLDQGYYRGMESFIKRISEGIEANMQGDENDRDCAVTYQVLPTLKEKTARKGSRTWLGGTMKSLAKSETDLFVKQRMGSIGDVWPRLQEMLCNLEDDPMPAEHKRRLFKLMYDGFQGNLLLREGNKYIHVGFEFFMF